MTITLAAGTPLGPYEIVAPLGAGGMGEVYRARDPRLGRDVAIKVLPEELTDEPDRLRRFETEAKAAGALNHPNVLAIHDIGKHEGRPYVVYELLEGETLGERMRSSRLSQNEVVDCAVQTARGLAAAHAKGIVHRDLKPENLFLTKDGPVKILDFGLAKLARPLPEDGASFDPEDLTRARESLTAEGTILGTVGYMSPEQVRGERADHRSDIFTLGVVLYEMLSGRRPFRGGTAPETMAAILKEDPPALLEDEVFPPLAEVVGRCLAKEPGERFQSAHDLALALEVLGASVAETRPAVTSIAPARMPVHWGRRLLLLGGALVVVTGLVLGLRPLLAPTGPPRMVNPRIVKSGDASPYFATDGRWLYQATPTGLFQMSVTGGEASRLDPWPDRTTIPAVRDLNPADATQLLVSGVEEVPESPFELAPLWVLSLPAATPRRVGEILSSAAVWSPDGGQIAFANDRDVYVVGVDGRSPRKIATVEGMAAWVDEWWPNGSIVYGSYDFTRRTLERWEVRVDGSEQRRLLPDWPDPIIWDVDRTPDGRTVVFVSGEETGGRFWALEEGRGEPVALTTDPLSCFKLDLAPDGSAVYSNCAHVRSELFTHRSEIGQWAPYDFAPEPSAWWLVDSPDREWVAWIKFPEGTLWRGRRDGTQKLRLTEPIENLYATFPSWSPDGRWIVFGGGTAQGIVQRTFVVSRDGEGLRRLDHETVWANRAAWSPDGRVILSFSGRFPLRLVDLETGRTEDMPGTTDLYGPTLSPDGSFLAASRRHNEGGLQLRLLDWKTGEWRDLEGAVGGLPAWSGDSRFLYFQNDQPEVPGEWQISRYRLDDGHIETVAKLANLDRQSALIWWTVDPEDRVVAQRSLTTNDIYAWDLVLP